MKKKALAVILSVIISLFLCACGAPEEPVVEESTEAEKMEQLLDLIEAGGSQYGGHTVSHDAGTITVSVWDEGITSTANAVLAQGSGAQDETWSQVKDEVETTVIHIADCIKNSEFASTKLLLHVLDHSDHSRKLLSFDNSGVAYDIVAETPTAPPVEPPAETEPTVGPPSSTPSTSPQPSQSGGGANNFNTHNNPEQQQTTASYVLNTNTMVFHTPSCRMVPRIAPENYATSNGTRSDVAGAGYSACGICHP